MIKFFPLIKSVVMLVLEFLENYFNKKVED